jgi:hypothetical protein
MLVSQSTSRRRGIFTVRGFVARLTLLFFLYHYFVSCPKDPSRSSLICRTYDTVEAQRHEIVRYAEPHLRPYLNRAQHKLEPYVERVKPYSDRLVPLYYRAESVAKPLAAKGQTLYFTHLHPRILARFQHAQDILRPYLDRLSEEYHGRVSPIIAHYQETSLAWYSAHVEPHLERLSEQARGVTGRVYPRYDKARSIIVPAYRRAATAIAPLGPASRQFYVETFRPFAIRSYRTSHHTYVTHVHPRLLEVLRVVKAAVGRFHSLYIRPQLEKIHAKIFEYKTKKAEKLAEREMATEVEHKSEEGLDELNGGYLFLSVQQKPLGIIRADLNGTQISSLNFAPRSTMPKPLRR